MKWPWTKDTSVEADSRDVMTATLNAQLETVADRLDTITIALFEKIGELQEVSKQVTDLREKKEPTHV